MEAEKEVGIKVEGTELVGIGEVGNKVEENWEVGMREEAVLVVGD